MRLMSAPCEINEADWELTYHLSQCVAPASCPFLTEEGSRT